MSCLDFRRSVLAGPGLRSMDSQAHIDECADCRAFLHHIRGLESRISEAVLVPVPEGLEERILLRNESRPRIRRARYAVAAAILVTAGLLTQGVTQRAHEPALPASTVAADETHAAAMAISFVLEHEPKLLHQDQQGDPAVLRESLARLGLRLPDGETTVRYLGKCPVPGGTGDHVVLFGPWGKVTLILVADQRVPQRSIVSVREQVAIAAPARDGGYILISDSLAQAKRMEDMIL